MKSECIQNINFMSKTELKINVLFPVYKGNGKRGQKLRKNCVRTLWMVHDFTTKNITNVTGP